MFQQRQINDIYQLVEVSYAAVSPGAITTGSKAVVTVNPVVGGVSGTSPSQCILGDQVLQVIAPASAGNLGGLIISAQVSAAGAMVVSFFNASAGTITPASAVYTIVTARFTPTLV